MWRHTKILRPAAHTGQEGLFWVQGVKLTTARATSVEVIDLVAGHLGKPLKPSKTHETRLYGADFSDYRGYRKSCLDRFGNRLPEQIILRLLANYGSNIEHIMEQIEHDPALSECIPGTTDTIKAELHYVIDNERPVTLSDLVMRRTDTGSLSCPGKDTLEFCADLMAVKFNWSGDERRQNMNDLLQCYPAHSHD